MVSWRWIDFTVIREETAQYSEGSYFQMVPILKGFYLDGSLFQIFYPKGSLYQRFLFRRVIVLE